MSLTQSKSFSRVHCCSQSRKWSGQGNDFLTSLRLGFLASRLPCFLASWLPCFELPRGIFFSTCYLRLSSKAGVVNGPVGCSAWLYEGHSQARNPFRNKQHGFNLGFNLALLIWKIVLHETSRVLWLVNCRKWDDGGLSKTKRGGRMKMDASK